MKFKKLLMSAALTIGIATMTAGCFPLTSVSPGYVGVMVHSAGSDRGVENKPYGVGYYYTGLFTTLYTFPTSTQNYTWNKTGNADDPANEEISFSDSAGMNITTDIGISYHIEADKAPALFQKYRRGIDEITNIYIHNMVRDALNEIGSQHPVEYIYGAGRPKIIADVQKKVQEQVKQYGIVVEKVYWIGTLRLPPAIQGALNSKQIALQQSLQRENQVATAKAQADIEVAKATGEANAKKIQADADAYVNKTIAASITSELVELRRIEKWKGNTPTVVTSGTSLLNLGNVK